MPDPEIPDGDLDILGSTESTEDREGRGEAFAGLLGIPDSQLALAIDQATRHALAATPAAIVHNWYPIGPRNIGGRIRELVQDPSDPLTMYAGSSAGGV
ncbi:MAG: hypothetical protein M3Y27_08575, partial [Acidobacteriota bacterium]|nr:hypothetical protein [Acidobacteriota bacterium]